MADKERPAADEGARKATGIDDDDRGDQATDRFEGSDHGTAPDVGQASDEVKESARKAYEAHDTQDESKSEGGAIYDPAPGTDEVGESVSQRAEELGTKKQEPGRHSEEEDEGDEKAGGAARPSGKADPRMATGVAPERSEVVDEDMPDDVGGDQGG
jgi:hypothetical protein